MARTILLLTFFLFSAASFGQIRTIPVIVEDAFKHKYPDASNVEFRDNLVNVHVNFELEGQKMTASFNNKGIWKETEKDWTFDQLTEEVKQGFQKSRYADWKIKETKVLYRPDGRERYKIKVEKGDLQKKNLMFSPEGRLIFEGATL